MYGCQLSTTVERADENTAILFESRTLASFSVFLLQVVVLRIFNPKSTASQQKYVIRIQSWQQSFGIDKPHQLLLFNPTSTLKYTWI